jgi:EAL domain-containing protein (putative c-di-GMP-specific phosphodiesterase class I)
VDALLDGQRVVWLAEQLQQRRIPGERLVLEFRHADVVSRLRQVATFWEGLQPTGVRMCIGGFEATMASYQALQHLPVEFLKVAPKYVSADNSSPALRQELRQVVNHARERNIRVIAPQVEDAGTAAQLWSSGADFIQGNFVQAATAELEFDFRASAL